MKRFSLRFLFDIIVDDSVMVDPYSSPDMSDIIARFGLTGLTETN